MSQNEGEALRKYFMFITQSNPASIYVLNFNNKNTRKKCFICSKLTTNILKESIGFVLVSLFLTLNKCHVLFQYFFLLTFNGYLCVRSSCSREFLIISVSKKKVKSLKNSNINLEALLRMNFYTDVLHT